MSLVQTLEGCTAGKQGSGCKPDRGASLPSGGAPAKLLYTTPQRQTFVGEAATPAGNYFTRDFRWEDLKDELASKGLLPDLTQEGGSGTDRELHVDGLVEPYDRDSWERFHRKDNATARFYKERRLVLLTQFPPLAFAAAADTAIVLIVTLAISRVSVDEISCILLSPYKRPIMLNAAQLHECTPIHPLALARFAMTEPAPTCSFCKPTNPKGR